MRDFDPGDDEGSAARVRSAPGVVDSTPRPAFNLGRLAATGLPPPSGREAPRRGLCWLATTGCRVVAMQRNLRASNAEREAVVERLEHAVAEGRITMAEFDERVTAAYAALTHGDLEPLVADLPRSLW